MVLLVAVGILVALVIGVVDLGAPPEKSGGRAHIAYVSHLPIVITSDAGFTAPGSGVTGGTGTASDPYIIEGWDIVSGGTYNECITIVTTTAHFIIRNCHLHGSGAIAVDMAWAPHAEVQNCLVDNGDIGISLYDSSDANITGNIVTNMDSAGIQVLISLWVNVSANTCTNDNESAILCTQSSYVTLVNNTASGNNLTGILIDNAAYMQIVGNNASSNGISGLQLNNTHYVVVQGNNITTNLVYGIWVSNSDNDLIYHNNLISNPVNGYQESSTNIRWNETYPTGGNYWSDKTGFDIYSGPGQDVLGSDGIYDTRYLIGPGASDWYPLVKETSGPLIPEFQGVLVPILGLILLCAALVRMNGRRPK